MPSSTLIRGGRLITASGEIRGDLLVVGEQIAAIGLDLSLERADQVIDAAGCVVLPGVIDPHTHIQLDTGIYKTPDDWEIGTRTAACGGVTTVIDFATQFPGQDVKQALASRLAEIGDRAQIDYALHMMLTALPEEDVTLDSWMAQLISAGVPSAKVYTTYRPNYYQGDAALLRVFRSAGAHGVMIMIHCENDAMVTAATEALVKAKETGLPNHGRARPALAEVEAAHRTLFLAEKSGTGNPNSAPEIYIVHCSASGTVDQVVEARSRGIRAIAETTPQYLLLDESVYAGPHPEWGIMQPPLRQRDEPELLWERLQSGAIYTVGTDHCDYTLEQKRASTKFTETPGGIPGIETLLPLLATFGVAKGRLTWQQLAHLLSENPARIFGLHRKGQLAAGFDADVVIYAPDQPSIIRASSLHNLAGYTPYEGVEVKGVVRDVMSRGRWLVRSGAFNPAPGWGQFVRGEPKR